MREQDAIKREVNETKVKDKMRKYKIKNKGREKN